MVNLKKDYLFSAIFYFLLISFGHQLIAKLYEKIFHYFGQDKIEIYDKYTFLITAIIIIIFFYLKNKEFNLNRKIILLWIITFILTFLSNKILICTNIELIHYYEYGILSIFLKKIFFNDFTALWIGTFAGIIDETYNYIFFPKYTKYLDFNDFILNFIGCLWGIVFYNTFFKNNYEAKSKLNKIIIFLFILLVLLFYSGIVSGHIVKFFPDNHNFSVFRIINNKICFILSFIKPKIWEITSFGKKYHILTSDEGIITICVLFFTSLLFFKNENKNNC